MNKTETVNIISHMTNIEVEKCINIFDSLEIVLTHQLKGAGGIKKFFDRICLLLDLLKTNDNKEKEEKELVGAVASKSKTSIEDTKKVLGSLVLILNDKIETSWSAKIKYETALRLVNFFRNK